MIARTGITAFLLFAIEVALADASAQLIHNPFSRPPSRVTVEAQGAFQEDGTIAPLDLRATMVGKNDKLANVGGRILRPGDEVQGHVLLQVFEDRAVFMKNGKRFDVYVKPARVEDDE